MRSEANNDFFLQASKCSQHVLCICDADFKCELDFISAIRFRVASEFKDVVLMLRLSVPLTRVVRFAERAASGERAR